jgi:hypothetical protein
MQGLSFEAALLELRRWLELYGEPRRVRMYRTVDRGWVVDVRQEPREQRVYRIDASTRVPSST